MNGKRLLLGLVGGAALAVSGAASATFVSFSDFSDAADGFFDVDATAAGAANGTALQIVMDNFAATASPGGNSFELAYDSISFTATAAPGFKIVAVGFAEALDGTVVDGVALATGDISIGGVGTRGFGTTTWVPGDSSLVKSIAPTAFDLSGSVHTSINVDITNTLLALGDATVAKTFGGLNFVVQEIAPVPVPAAVVLLGTALMGLVVVRRRGGSAR